jgi:hypothetical protein
MEAKTVSSSKRGDSGPAAGTPNPLTDYMDKEREDAVHKNAVKT